MTMKIPSEALTLNSHYRCRVNCHEDQAVTPELGQFSSFFEARTESPTIPISSPENLTPLDLFSWDRVMDKLFNYFGVPLLP